MEKIRSLFAKPIDRKIEEVIKGGQANEQPVLSELEEYIGTDSIKDHFERVYDEIIAVSKSPREGIGVWVSGFFGSGKSSFAKILGYTVAAIPVSGRPASEIFKENVKDAKVSGLIDVINRTLPTHAVIFDVSMDRGIQGQTLHAGIVEIHVGEGANLRFVELQSWGDHVWNFSHERARVSRDGQLDWIIGAIGSQITKNFSDLDLIGEGASGRMSGFYFTDGIQHLDHDTQQNRLAPHTTSDLHFKGALKDRSRSVWQGMIYVAPGAQKTDGYQANRDLTLSPQARADSIPGLEILADDVRCTHGATVGKIDPDEVFYLRSRGIPPKEAKRLIVEGFFDPIMQRIPFEGVRRRFQSAILEKML